MTKHSTLLNTRLPRTSLTGFTCLFSIVLIFVFLLGLMVRLIDLNDPPLDFNPTRQLRSATIARGLYYKHASNVDPEKQELAITLMNSLERLEPPIFETLVSWSYYLLGGENLAFARVFAILFWLIGAVFLFDLGRRMTSPWASLVGLCVYLFLPFSIRASRSFQPDPGMVTLVILTAWTLNRWIDERSWKFALLSGFFGGIAVLIKPGAVFFVGWITLGLIFYVLWINDSLEKENQSSSFKATLMTVMRDPQIWLMLILMLIPGFIYYISNLWLPGSGSFLHWTIFNRWLDVLSPSFYMRWMVQLDDIFGLLLVLAALIGSFLTNPRNRGLLWGFWLGYFLFCLFFPYHTLTHDYYHLPLVALIALSLMPLVELIIKQVRRQGVFPQIGLVMVLILFFSYNFWIGRSILVGQDYKTHPAFWQTVSHSIPPDSKTIGLSQDYGLRLMYYGWRKIDLWPINADPENLADIAEGASYFVVTAKNQMSPDLEEYLQTNFEIYAEGPGYIIFDLQGSFTD